MSIFIVLASNSKILILSISHINISIFLLKNYTFKIKHKLIVSHKNSLFLFFKYQKFKHFLFCFFKFQSLIFYFVKLTNNKLN